MARTKKVEQVEEIILTEEEQEAILVDQMAEARGETVPEVDASGRKKKVTITHEELEAKGLKNKSQVIRYLDSEGFSRSAIAGFLNVRYQHVRNVLITPLKKG